MNCGNPRGCPYSVRMRQNSTGQNPSALSLFQSLLSGEAPDLAGIEMLLPRLKAEGAIEQAYEVFRRVKPRKPVTKGSAADPWQAVRVSLEEEADRARRQRMSHWQQDSRRCTLRLCFEAKGEACRLHPPALQASLAQALRSAGLPVALGLEKTPRPLVTLGHVLPLGVAGLAEWADVVLERPAGVPLAALPALVQPHCLEGLRILEALAIPNIASPVLELSREAHWRWLCPSDRLEEARERLGRFEASERFSIDKTGKVAGQKQIKQVEVRALVLALEWRGCDLHFSTRIAAGEALNPVKLLAGILGWEAAEITDLARERVVLVDDPRLAQAAKYETKLHNIYEDAVLLDGGYGVEAVVDDDEPLWLNRDSRA